MGTSRPSIWSSSLRAGTAGAYVNNSSRAGLCVPDQPRPRRTEGRVHAGPLVPPARGRAGVNPFRCDILTQVMPEILQHVPDRVPDLAQCLQDVRVKALGEYLAPASADAVERARDPDGEALDCPRKREGVVGLQDEVQVVPLNGVVHDPHPEALLRRAERILDRAPAGEPA